MNRSGRWDLCGQRSAQRPTVPTHPENNRDVVEYAVIACSCSPSHANEWPKATHAGAKRESIRLALLK